LSNRFVLPAVLALAVALLVFTQVRETMAGVSPWTFMVVGGAAIVVLVFAVRFERSGVHARVLAIVALLGTLSALLRLPFAPIPNLQPSTYLIICSGYVFGPVSGFAVGALTAIVSNFFLGHGPWTLFQVLSWGLAGASAVVLRRFTLSGRLLVVAGISWGVLFGVIMNLWTWIAFVYPLTWRTFVVTWMASIPFDVMHAAGNALFLGLLGVRTIRILERYQGRFTWVWLGEDGESSRDDLDPNSRVE
jgi:energy-coupling factor transport system substrate-specific component